MLTILVIGGLAWGFARVLDAPQWVIRLIPVAMALSALAALVLLPAGHPMRSSIGSSLQFLTILCILAVPVGLYVFWLRRLRRRNEGADKADASAAKGFVLIQNDIALRADVDRLKAGQGNVSEQFSILYRDEAGGIAATARCEIHKGLATFSGFWVVDEPLRAALLDTLEEEAAWFDATCAVLDSPDAGDEAFLVGCGYRVYSRLALPEGSTRIWLTKDLK